MSELPRAVVDELPAWKGATIEKLGAGSNNTVYLVTQGSERGVLKIDSGPRERPFNSRSEEAAVQAIAAGAGLAGRILAVGTTMIFCEYLEGSTWERASLRNAENLERTALALKKMHSLPLTGRSFDASIAARRYLEKTEHLDAAIADRCQQIIASMRLPQNLCCCHNDLVAENMVATPDLKFLDWEYACDNDPFFDLATVVEHHELTDGEARLLLDVYFDGNGERWREHLEKQRRLYLALLCLWMAARPDCDVRQLDGVAKRLLTSCS
tara:strand:+ start:2237 stop:3043 length:807 start_codon:yes stop_codon:yes gene_type:complete